ncbi:MAG TPA: DUF2490 domain-containing protein [Pyrinomonadaceae bacterium]
MRNSLYVLLLFVLVFFLTTAVTPILGQTAEPDSDFQVWNETALIFPVVKTKDASGKESDKLSLIVFGSIRLGQNRLFPVDARVGTGFDLKLNKYWSFSPTYVYRRGEPLRNRKEFEHRLRFDVTVGHKWKNFSLKDRSRYEYRIRNSRSDSSRYRNKFTFAFPVRSEGKEIFSPYVSDEVYYDFTAKEFSTNEISAGISRKLSSNTSADFYWLRRDFRSGQIRHFNAVGVNLKIRID